MKLYTNPLSPYARKARIIAHELDLKLELVEAVPATPEMRRVNPLGKIPALVLDDGSVLIDSPVICEYLNHLGGGKFFPGMNFWRHAGGRWKALGLQALADGVCDALVARVIETRQETPNAKLMERYMAAIEAGLDALDRSRFADPPTIGEIATACMIGYLDVRLPDMAWRATRPKLAAWYEKFAQYPAMQATAPKA